MTTFSISKLCASYDGGDGFFAEFQSLAQQLEGVEDVVFRAADKPAVHPGPSRIFTSVPVRYLDQVAGELHLFYDPRQFSNRSALPLAEFLARQLSMAFQVVAVRGLNTALRNEYSELEAEIQEHKLLEKARGVIESRRLIPAGEGQRLMQKVSAQSGRKLRDLAQGIVASAERNPWKFRREFWA